MTSVGWLQLTRLPPLTSILPELKLFRNLEQHDSVGGGGQRGGRGVAILRVPSLRRNYVELTHLWCFFIRKMEILRNKYYRLQ